MAYRRIKCSNIQPNTGDNRIAIVLATGESYAVNQRVLDRYDTPEELRAALDKWAQQNLGYVLDDIWFHKNRDGTWAIATGEVPSVWPEDEAEL